MKKFQVLALAFATLLLSGHGAFALSIEQRDTTNSDGTQKFSDPDEQTPPGLVGPGSSSGNNAVGMSESSVNAPSLPQVMGIDQGNQAFDHAYNHLQNQR